MSELSILELETEHAELLPERETLFIIGLGGHNHHVTVNQTALAIASRDHREHGGRGQPRAYWLRRDSPRGAPA